MPAPRAQRLMQTVLFGAGLLCSGMFGAPAFAQAQRPSVDSHGNVSVPAFVVPYSAYASPEAQQQFQRMLEQSRHAPGIGSIAASRAYYDGINTDRADRMQKLYPVKIHTETIGGVPTDVVLPAQGIAAGQRHRVLINLHGGAFLWGAHSGGLVEAIPLASLGRIKVVSVDYRQGPEHVFPAASEDVEAVYRALLKQYPARNIGIYGCSAGGSLSGQVAAWLPAHGLPQAGAIGIFGAGASRAPGDSSYLAAFVDGSYDPPPGRKRPYREYFDGANLDDPMISPAQYPDVLKKFPPTLLITGTRAPDLSAAVYAHSQLIKAGVPGDLIVGEGMAHCYILMSSLPESQDAYQAIVKFFRDHLG